jgi:hypothetical protein
MILPYAGNEDGASTNVNMVEELAQSRPKLGRAGEFKFKPEVANHDK